MTSDFAPSYALSSLMGNSGFNSSLMLVSIRFFFPFFFFSFWTKLFKESMLIFAVDAQVLFLTAVLELRTQGIGCC